jgi:hypothetical protein
MPSQALRFLNVDLEIESRRSPTPLVAALERSTVVLASFRRRGYHVVTLELVRSPNSAAAAMRSFVRLVRQLPPTARSIWRASRRRDFDAGFELLAGRHVVSLQVPPEVAQQVATVGGRIVFTLYPARRTRRSGSKPGRPAIPRRK